MSFLGLGFYPIILSNIHCLIVGANGFYRRPKQPFSRQPLNSYIDLLIIQEGATFPCISEYLDAIEITVVVPICQGNALKNDREIVLAIVVGGGLDDLYNRPH